MLTGNGQGGSGEMVGFQRAAWCCIAAVSAATLVGCGKTVEHYPAASTVTRTVASSSSTAAATSAPTTLPGDITDQDRVFLSDLQSSSQWDGFFSGVSRGSLFDSAHMVCDKFARDGKVTTMKSLLDAGFNVDQAAVFMHAAAMAYCPKNLSGVQ